MGIEKVDGVMIYQGGSADLLFCTMIGGAMAMGMPEKARGIVREDWVRTNHERYTNGAWREQGGSKCLIGYIAYGAGSQDL